MTLRSGLGSQLRHLFRIFFKLENGLQEFWESSKPSLKTCFQPMLCKTMKKRIERNSSIMQKYDLLTSSGSLLVNVMVDVKRLRNLLLNQ
eukprot:c40828_g1_i1 orf=137-406(-)